jgi:molecular chaperone DnaJ
LSTKDDLEKDYYAVLGVPSTASAAEIKKAYRKLARTFHPDANKGDAAAEERFKDISAAYDVLSDDTRRKEYDELRRLGSSGFRFPGGARGRGGATYDVNDLFGGGAGAGMGDLGDLLGGIFGRAGRRGGGTSAGPRRGADVESDVRLDFREAVHGVTVPLRVTNEGACTTCHGSGARPGTAPRTCPTCQGSGQVSRDVGAGFAFAEPCHDCGGRGQLVDDPCPTCHGTGHSSRTRSVHARIPAGVKDGARIRLKAKGSPGERGGPNGDLYITVHVAPHPAFGRRGDHVTLTVPVTFAEAALGADISVPTLEGTPVTLRVPTGTSSGQTFRVKGRGVPTRDGASGDLLVTVVVAVPQRLNADARTAVEAYRAATKGDDPRADLFAEAGR